MERAAERLRPTRPTLLLAAAVVLVLILCAGRYGYHRDELYFVAAGEHLSWGYADQGPLTPLLARAMSEISAGSLTVLRIPSALAAGLIVLLTGLLARDLGGDRRAEWIAAGCSAAASIVLFTGHLLNSSTFDLLTWTVATWLIVRAVSTDRGPLWVAAGVVIGLGLLNKPLPAFLLAGLFAGVLTAGPRRLLRDPWVWTGVAVAVAMFAPWLIWQASNDWPQFDVAEAIASGGSTSSEAWWAVVPFQLLLFGPPLAFVWILGLVRLFRDPDLRDLRFFAWAFLVLAVVFTATAGKPYYLSGLVPVLIAAGSVPVAAWIGRGRTAFRASAIAAVIAVSALISALISLPLLPERNAGPVVEVNEDVGETIGWPELAARVATAAGPDAGRPAAVIFTGNYGEAGALERFGPALGLPAVYSGHNAYGDWGPPSEGLAPVVALGLDARERELLGGCRKKGLVDNEAGIDNDEQGAPIWLCAGPVSWAEVWPDLVHLG